MWSKGIPPLWYRDLGFGGVMKSQVGEASQRLGKVCFQQEKSQRKCHHPVLGFFSFFFSISLLFQLLTLSETLNLCTF